MEIEQAQFGNVVVLAPSGRIDHATSEAFRQRLETLIDGATRDAHPLVFDLSRVEYFSSAGLRCFMLAARQAKADGSAMIVAALQPVVNEISESCRFALVLETLPKLRDALAKLAPDAAATINPDH